MEAENDIKTAQAVDEAMKKEDNLIRLSSGVVLRGKQAPPLVLIKVMTAFPRPKIPVFFSKSMGREMENPDDPDYQDRVKAWRSESSNALLNALIILGTELVSTPKGLPGPDSDKWLEEYSTLGIPMLPENKNWRYLTWITLKAATTEEDLTRIQEVVGRLSGIPESKVSAAESFPGSEPQSG